MARVRGHGTLLQISDMLTTPAFTTIAQVNNIRGPNITRGFDATPDHDMSGGIDKLADALYDAGQITFDLKWDPANATHVGTTGVRKRLLDGSTVNFKLVFPDSGTYEIAFSGFVTEMTPDAPANRGYLTCSCTIELSGDVTETT